MSENVQIDRHGLHLLLLALGASISRFKKDEFAYPVIENALSFVKELDASLTGKQEEHNDQRQSDV